MATKKTNKSPKSILKKEVNIPLPKNKAGDFLGKKRNIHGPKYFRESYQELKKVKWPTRKEALKLTFAVFIFTAIFTILISIADWGFSNLVEGIFL